MARGRASVAPQPESASPAKIAANAKPSPPSTPPSSLQWYLGMALASIFSLSYFVGPFYMLSAVAALLFRYPTRNVAALYALPILVSALLPPVPAPWLVRWLLRPMLTYFDYEEIVESSPINVRDKVRNGTNYLLVLQPHGAVSFCGICSAVSAPLEFVGHWNFPTAVADALLYTPLLKHVMGVFGLISASKKSMVKTLAQPGPKGCVVLYVGGMAELFLSCENEEKLYLKARKGFIKLALTAGVDIVPIYLFGNTTVLSVLKTGLLADLSRKLQVSLTYVWGKWYLPVPRSTKLLYVSGQPLGMPKIENPSQDDIDKWHATYCAQVKRLFDLYKERVPEYKHKQLEIL